MEIGKLSSTSNELDILIATQMTTKYHLSYLSFIFYFSLFQFIIHKHYIKLLS